MIKIAFFDIDWTLYNHKEHQWIESSLDAIKQLQNKGIKCFVCSARSYQSCKTFGVFNVGIKWDGGIFSAGSTGFIKSKLLYTEKIPQSEAIRFIKLLHSLGCMVEVVGTKRTAYSRKPNLYLKEYRKDYKDFDPMTRKYDGKLVTCFLAFAPKEVDEIVKKEFPNMYMFRYHKYALDCKGWAYTKGYGVNKVLSYYGFNKEEAIGFGDDVQDISIAENVGTFVAMGNGRDEVKKVATYVSEPIWDDGICKVLKQIKLIN